MNGDYVFDTEAIIVYLYNEPSHEVAADLLDQVFSDKTDGVLTDINASEVFYSVARFEGTDDMPTEASHWSIRTQLRLPTKMKQHWSREQTMTSIICLSILS